MPSSLFRRTSAASVPTKTIVLVALLVSLFLASSWNLMSFSKINIHIGDVHHATSEAGNKPSQQTPNAPNSSKMSTDKAIHTVDSTVTTSTTSSSSDPESPIFKIEAGIKALASAGIDPFSIALVHPTLEIKKAEMQKLTPFYQLLITQNKDIKVVEPPPPPKPKEDPKTTAGGITVETIPVVPNPIDGIKLSGVSYMPKRSFAMLNVSGAAQSTIVAQGEIISVAGQSVKVVSIERGKVTLSWMDSPKGVYGTQQLTIPAIIGYKPTSSSSSGGGGGATGTPPGGGGGSPPPSSPSSGIPTGYTPPSGGSSSNKGGPPPPANTPEAIEKLVDAAMKN